MVITLRARLDKVVSTVAEALIAVIAHPPRAPHRHRVVLVIPPMIALIILEGRKAIRTGRMLSNVDRYEDRYARDIYLDKSIIEHVCV